MREIDFVARIGGEEFVVLLPDITVQQARATAERIRERIARLRIEHDGEPVSFTASFGVTQIEESDTGYEALLQRADEVAAGI